MQLVDMTFSQHRLCQSCFQPYTASYAMHLPNSLRPEKNAVLYMLFVSIALIPYYCDLLCNTDQHVCCQ